jgi:hypothetical protein
MELNLPIFDHLSSCQNLLIAGMGGGFDIFCGLPIYFELQKRVPRVHLANLSFSDLGVSYYIARRENIVILSDTLVGVTAKTGVFRGYFPELYLSQWFAEKKHEDVTIWCFHKTGVQPLLSNYRTLIEHLGIDGILLIDGGVDSLVRGDETEMATFAEDAVSLCALSQLIEIQTRLMACIGLGAERDISYAHILENIAELAANNGFLGSSSLVKKMSVYQNYEDAVLYVQNKREQEASVINSSIISAVQGYYGDYHLTDKTKGSKLWISPLMPIYWFFELESVVNRHLFLPQLLSTETFSDVLAAVWTVLHHRQTRSPARIPLS